MSNLSQINDFDSKPGEELRIAQAAVKIYRGGAVGVVSGTGYATPLVIATAGMQFIGVSEETSDNTNGTPGTFTYGPPLTGLSPFIRLRRKGLVLFAQSGTTITQAAVQTLCYFSDDHTVTTTPGAIVAGMIATIDESGGVWVDISNAVMPIPNPTTGITVQTGDFTPSPHVSAKFVLTKGTAAAVTLGAPTATTDDGVVLRFTSATAAAHVITATGLIGSGSTTTNTATFAADAGAAVEFVAYQGKWLVQFANAITFA